MHFICMTMETEGNDVPVPSELKNVELSTGEFANYIACNTREYAKMHNNKAVKKTLTIPEWLNEAAIQSGGKFFAGASGSIDGRK